MERRIVAILAGDMVGYSRLIELDETGTLARQRKLMLELIDPTIERMNGHIVKLTGDGMIAEFGSVIEAVQCAVAIQKEMIAREEDQPEDRRIQYRVAVNLGDVVFEDGDVYGDGVNIAARLEELAEPGGIVVSGTAYDLLKTNVDVGYRLLGEKHLKNIATPVRVYQVTGDVASLPPLAKVTRHIKMMTVAALAVLALVAAGWWYSQRHGSTSTNPDNYSAELSDKPSIAVLPFDNLSNDPEQAYFAEGLSVDLITDLSRISGLMVISRASSFAYIDQPMDIRQIGENLGSRYLVEGSIRRIDDNLRITAQLTDSETGEYIWADRYDSDIEGLFEFQEEVRNQIVQALRVKLSAREQKWLARRPTSDPEAYDYYLQGLKQESFFTKENNSNSRMLFERAIEIDPSFAAAYSKLAQAYSLAQENGWTEERETFAVKAIELAEKAVALDDDLPQAHWALARIYSRQPFADPEKSMEAIRRAVELDPNFSDGLAFMASRLTAAGNPEDALGALEKAMQINPNYPFWYIFELGRAQYFLTRYDAAVQSFQKTIERNPSVGWPRRWLISTYGHLGNLDDAEWEMLELESINSAITVSEIERSTTIHHPPYLAQFLDGLRKAGVAEN